MKIPLLIFALICSFVPGRAQNQPRTLEFTLGGGYQSANLRWSIAGNSSGGSPNIYSELKWRAISGPMVQPQLRINITRKWFAAGDFSRCFIRSGHVTDTDYADDNRNSPTYNALLDSDEGHLTNYQLYTGYQFVYIKRFKLAVFAGYNSSKEHLFLLQHSENVAGYKNLRSTYQTNWRGGLAGLSAAYQVMPRVDLRGVLSYRQLKYHAQADWNMVDAFQHPLSFEHCANGFDLGASLSCSYRSNSYLSLFIAGAYRRSQTGKGIDDLYLESGSIRSTQFNGAVKRLQSITFGTILHL
jgi:outer membrane protease